MRERSKSAPLTIDEVSQLEQWAREGNVPDTLTLRARIVLDCQRGLPKRTIARELKITPQTVSKWWARFTHSRLAGLHDSNRSGAPRSIDDTLVQAVVSKTLHSRPIQSKRWTSRALARELGVSQSTVLRIWRNFGIKPPRRPD